MRKPPKGWALDKETKHITRQGVHIATYTPDETEPVKWVSEEFRKYAPPVASVVKSYEASFEKTIDAVNAAIAAQDAAKTVTLNTVEDVTILEVPAEAVVEPEEVIPPMPKVNPQLGDKTHEIVDWYRKYHPEEFIKKYRGRVVYDGRVEADGTVTPVADNKRRRGGIPLGNM